MRSPLLSSAATALFFLAQSQSIDAATLTPRFPIQEGSTSINVPLTKRTVVKDLASFTRKAEHMKAKYAPKAVKDKRLREKRASSNSISMTNYEDVEYYGTIKVGTPAVSYSVILDTGSADLVLATSPCSGCVSTTTLYSASSSSTAETSTEQFSITYGTGDASGTLAQDVVSIAGLTVSKQVFGSCDVIDNIVSGSISGLLGLGWEALSSSQSTPLLQALAQNNTLSSNVFAFAFTTYSETSTIKVTSAGGTMTIGATDSSLFSGSINWIDVVTPESYWQIPLQGISVGGVNLDITSASVVIDSGTSLVGGPTSAVEAIYAQITGGAAVTSSSGGRGGGEQVSNSGYYSYDCSASVNISFTFGGVAYSIPSANFNSGYLDSSGKTCLGAVFAMDSTTVPWIFGDSFLVGLYSAFRFSPNPAVGFATLGSGGSSSTSNSSLTGDSSTSSSTGSSGTSAASPTASGSMGTISVGRVSIPLGGVVAGMVAVAVGYQNW